MHAHVRGGVDREEQVVRTLATTPTATSVQARDEGSKHQAAAAAAGSSEVVVGGGVETWGGKETKFCGREEGIQYSHTRYSTRWQPTHFTSSAHAHGHGDVDGDGELEMRWRASKQLRPAGGGRAAAAGSPLLSFCDCLHCRHCHCDYRALGTTRHQYTLMLGEGLDRRPPL